MPTVSLTKSYADGVDLTESQLDDLKNSIETALNTTKLDSDNIQTGGISAGALATGAVTTAKLDASAVTTAKITDSNVTTAKIADSNVTTVKINDLAITTAKINTAAVTQAKLASRTVTTDGTDPGAGGVVFSASSGTFSTDSTSYTDVTNLSVTLTTLGRPVRIFLDTADGTNESFLRAIVDTSASNPFAKYKLVRDITDIKITDIASTSGSSSASVQIVVPVGSLDFLDTPAAGTYVYKLQTLAGSNNVSDVRHARLVAYEI